MAHPGWPWHDEQLAIAVHKENTFIDLSGVVPEVLPTAPRNLIGKDDSAQVSVRNGLSDVNSKPVAP